jgi:hypothetical protein
MVLTTTERRVSRLSLAAFLLALVMTVTSTLVAVWWDPIDARILTAVDDAGWVPGLLVPHQELLWLAVNGAALLSVVLTVVTFVALLRSVPPMIDSAGGD